MPNPTLSTLLDNGVVREGFEVLAPGLPEHSNSEDLVTWNLQRVRDEVEAMGSRLGPPPGHGTPVVAIVLPEGIRVPIAALAAVRSGRIPLMINPRLDKDAIGHLLQHSGASEVITIAEEVPPAASIAVASSGLESLDGHLIAATTPSRSQAVARTPEAPAALFHTSGTTGLPKIVMWSDRQAVSGAWHYVTDELMPSLKSFILAMPATHTAGLAFFSMCALGGIRAIVLPLPEPETLIASSRAAQPDAVAAFSTTLTELVASGRQDELADSVKLWVNMGDTAHAKHVRALVDSANRPPDFAVGDGLGSSEMGWGAFRHRIKRGDRPQPRCVGKPAPGTSATVLSPDGDPVPDGQPGLLAVASEHVAPGYWNDQTRYWADRRGEFFITGDIAVRDSDGNYFQLDRRTDVIDHETGIYSLLLEERIMNSHPDILDASVFTEQKTREVTAAIRFFTNVGQEAKKHIFEALQDSNIPSIIRYVEWTNMHIATGATGKVRKVFSGTSQEEIQGMSLPEHLVTLTPPSKTDLAMTLSQQIEKARKSEFYQQILDSDTCFEELSPTTKEDLRSGYPFGFLAVPRREVATYHESSGTTGIPSVSFYTEREWRELGIRFDRKPSEIIADDVFLIRIPYAFVVAGMLADACGRQKGATVIAGASRTLAAPPSRAARVIKDLNVTKTWSSPTEILLIASAMVAQGNDPARDAPNLRNIFLGGEPLPPAKQRFISQSWGGAEVAQEFGCTEAGSLAGTWPDGTIRWWSDIALAEVLCDDGKIRRDGTGQLLITPLLREAMPLLRYETGDRVTLSNGNDTEFPIITFHGRGPTLPGGLTAGAVEQAFYEALTPGELLFWRASVDDSKINIEIEPTPGISVSPARRREIGETMAEALGRTVEITETPRGTLVDPAILDAKTDAMKPSRVFAAGQLWDSARIRA
jgi:coenzyme F390 synthetase